MTVRLLEVAQQELDEAIVYYNGESPWLGDAFLLETVATIDRIRRFPYGLIYSIDKDDVLILAVAHTHREPSYWRDRIGSGRHSPG